MNIVEELIGTLKEHKLHKGYTPEQADKFISGYLIGFLESYCLNDTEFAKVVAWHVKHVQDLQ